jgi:hypothetical protein
VRQRETIGTLDQIGWSHKNQIVAMTQADLSTSTQSNSAFQRAIEAVEALSLEDQQALLELLQQRLADQQRQALSQEISEVRQEYAEGCGLSSV